MEANDYILLQIGNTDQTPVFFEIPRNKTVAPEGYKNILVNAIAADKLCCTVMLCITADGNKFLLMSSSNRNRYKRNVYHQ